MAISQLYSLAMMNPVHARDSQAVSWYHSVDFRFFLTMMITAGILFLAVLYVVNTDGREAALAEADRRMEQTGNRMVEMLKVRSHEIAALVRTIATIADALPKDEAVFKRDLPPIFDFSGDLGVAGGGIWPEPGQFSKSVERRSFFWGRDRKADNKFAYYDDYNALEGAGYHHEAWYVVSRYLEPGRCFWSESYIDPYSDQPMVTCSVGMFHDDVFTGVATIDLKLEHMTTLLQDWEQKRSGYAVLLDRNGKIIAFPSAGERAMRKVKHMGEPLTVNAFAAKYPRFQPIAEEIDTAKALILENAKETIHYSPELVGLIARDSYQINRSESELITAIIADPLDLKSRISHQFGKVDITNDVILDQPATAYFFHVPDAYWKLIIVEPKGEATVIAKDLTQNLILKIGGLSLILLLLAYVLLRNVFAKPLAGMATTLSGVTSAHPEDHIGVLRSLSLPVALNNEIGVLARAFRSFAHELADVQEDLELRISERTTQLATTEAALTTLLEDMHEVYYRVDLQGNILEISPAIMSLTGYEMSEVLGSSTLRFYTHIDERHAYLEKLNKDGVVRDYRLHLNHKSGRMMTVSMNARMRYDTEGAAEGVEGIFSDISEQIEGEERQKKLMAQAQKMQHLESLGVLAAGIAHDFNNILTVILGNATIAMMDCSPGTELYEQLEAISQSCDRASLLSKQMLAYSGRGTILNQSVHLSRLITEMGELIRVSVSKHIHLVWQLQDNMPVIAGDAKQMQQVVMGLVMNASEAIGDAKGVIHCRTGVMKADADVLPQGKSVIGEPLVSGEYAWLEVSDDGCGMDEDVLVKLFEPFFTTKLAGSGLGMSTVMGVVGAHAGTVTVYSEKGKGSRLRVLLPISTPETDVSNGLKVRDTWQGNGTILIIDDEESLRMTIKSMLESCGFSVLLAETGIEGLERFSEHRDSIVAVIVDLTMPGLDSHAICERLLKLDSEVRLILSSGYQHDQVRGDFSDLEVADFIQKPYSITRLRQQLFQLFDT
ncbi:MAG: response regulator [Mariprofundaceae bacterium]